MFVNPSRIRLSSGKSDNQGATQHSHGLVRASFVRQMARTGAVPPRTGPVSSVQYVCNVIAQWPCSAGSLLRTAPTHPGCLDITSWLWGTRISGYAVYISRMHCRFVVSVLCEWSLYRISRQTLVPSAECAEGGQLSWFVKVRQHPRLSLWSTLSLAHIGAFGDGRHSPALQRRHESMTAPAIELFGK